MSEENKPSEITIPQEPVSDLTERDLNIVKKYIEDGLPGIGTVDETKIARMFDLYLSGKTYRQVSMILGQKKEIVLYLSHKFDWATKRMEYLVDLEQSMHGRMMEAKVVNQDFLLQLVHMWQKKIGSKINKYLATNNEEFANSIDLKEVDKYLKTVEILHRLNTEKMAGMSNPAIGLNVGDGITVTKKGDNEVEITPKQKSVGALLKEFADMRRASENENK